MIELYAAFFVIAVFYIAIFLFHKQIKSEEAFMENAFGQDYLDYKKRVTRYL